MALSGQHEDSRPPIRAAAPPAWPWPDPWLSIACAWDAAGGARLSERELADRAQQRLVRLIGFARRHAPFYRDLYAAVPETAAPMLSELPVTTRRTLMSEFDRVVTRPGLDRAAVDVLLADPSRIGEPFAGGCAVWTSSGTSGTPGVFVQDPAALAVYDALQFFRFHPGMQAGDPVGGFSLPTTERYALVAATGGHFAGEAGVQRMRRVYPWLAPFLRVFSVLQPLDELVAQLNSFAPEVLATYPTVAAVLAQERLAGRLQFAPRRIWTGAECLSEATRRSLQEAFGAQVRDEYGASEFSFIAADCAEGWLHVNADWVLLEPVDEQYRAVAPGTASHTVLLTNLANLAQPLIRYDLGDSIVAHPGRCRCGNPLPAIRVQGRCDDLLQMLRRDGAELRVLPLALTTVLEEEAGVYDFQLEQTGPLGMRLRLGSGEQDRADAAIHSLVSYLARQGVDGVQIGISGNPPQRGGAGTKLRRILGMHRLAGAQTDGNNWAGNLAVPITVESSGKTPPEGS